MVQAQQPSESYLSLRAYRSLERYQTIAIPEVEFIPIVSSFYILGLPCTPAKAAAHERGEGSRRSPAGAAQELARLTDGTPVFGPKTSKQAEAEKKGEVFAFLAQTLMEMAEEVQGMKEPNLVAHFLLGLYRRFTEMLDSELEFDDF